MSDRELLEMLNTMCADAVEWAINDTPTSDYWKAICCAMQSLICQQLQHGTGEK